MRINGCIRTDDHDHTKAEELELWEISRTLIPHFEQEFIRRHCWQEER